MNLVKWFRKNNTKIMAVVVIVLMVGFIGGSSLTYLLRGGGGNKAVAYYGRKHKITRYDRATAGQELDILAALRADQILRSSQDLQSVLLSDLLFSQNRDSGAVLDMVRQTIQRNRYRISEQQLSEIYKNRTVPSDIYWILLREEAASAGIRVPPEDVATWLRQLIAQNPQVFGSGSYVQVMQSLVNRYNAPEEKILATLGRLLAVLQYAQILTGMENVTASQIRHMASREGETLDVEFMQLEASDFADKEQTPSEDALREHFDQYKGYFPGEVSEANPFGFGYKLPSRVQLDTIALKLEDVASIVKPPTDEETEQYYLENRERLYTEQVPTDPNDPNSPRVPQAKRYAEVADTIRDQLRRQKITTRAEQILLEARNLADADLQPTGSEDQESTVEQRRQRAGDYEKIAQDLGSKHSIPLYSGRTGLLDAVAVQADQYLGRMFLTSYGRSPVPLVQVLFSVKELGDDATIVLSIPPVEMYGSIGPVRDPMAAMTPDLADQIMLIARVVEVNAKAAPENLDVSYSTKAFRLGDASAEEQEEETFSVRDEVVTDFRQVTAWETTKSRADEFLALTTKEGWDRAATRFNQLYGEQAKADPNDPNVFAMDRLTGLRRISDAQLHVLAAQVANNPAAEVFMNETRAESQLINRLYALAPADGNAVALMPTIMDFKPNQSYYVLKSLSVDRLNQEEFRKMKSMLVRREDYSQAQSLAVVHLNPENILKRMNFRPADRPTEDAAEKEPEDAS
jgi:hypothetical protein